MWKFEISLHLKHVNMSNKIIPCWINLFCWSFTRFLPALKNRRVFSDTLWFVNWSVQAALWVSLGKAPNTTLHESSLSPQTAVRRYHINSIVTVLSLMVEVINPGIKTVISNLTTARLSLRHPPSFCFP